MSILSRQKNPTTSSQISFGYLIINQLTTIQNDKETEISCVCTHRSADTTCVITVYEPNSTTIYDQARCQYLYSETTGAFSVEYDDWNVKGYIKGDKMTLTDNRYGNFTLTRVK